MEFQKCAVAPGQYRFTNHIEYVDKPKHEVSGLRQKVKELKDVHPQWTKQDVLNYLKSTNFDFKDKRPVNAVNMAWAYLGYFKENKQQSLPGVV
jgi:hypothetical protein